MATQQPKVITAEADFEAPVKHLCETEFGEGACGSTLPDAEKESRRAASKRLRSWCSLRRLRACKFDAKWDKLGLLYMGPRDAGALAADAFLPGCAILLLYAERYPFTCVVCWRSSFAPEPGDIIEFRLTLETIATESWVART